MQHVLPVVGSKKLFKVILTVALIAGFAGCAGTPEKKDTKQKELVFPPPPEKPRFYFDRTIRSSLDIVVEDDVSAFRRFATGEQQRGDGLAKPFDIVATNGRIYVGDTVRRAVLVFDIRNKRFFQIGQEEPGKLYLPLGMAKDAAGNLYVVDGTAKRVLIYDEKGDFLRAIGGKDYFHRPSGLAVEPNGERVYVVDTGGVDTQEHRVRVFNGHTGEHLFDIGTRGGKEGQFNLPRDATIAPDGKLYVVDGGNFRIQVFEPDGTFIKTFGAVGRRSGQFSRPKGIAADPSGNIYVSDTAFGNFQIFDPDGNLLLYVGSRGARDRPAEYMLPAGIDVDEEGRVYMVEQFFRRIDIYRPATIPPLTEGTLTKDSPPSK